MVALVFVPQLALPDRMLPHGGLAAALGVLERHGVVVLEAMACGREHVGIFTGD